MLLLDRDRDEPLFLQIKEAVPSALEPHVAPGAYSHQGERVVQGQRLMQAAPDIFLGWSQGQTAPQYYWRHFHDRSRAVDVSAMDPNQLNRYADVCGWTLAHSHARSGDVVAISAYLGSSTTFDEAVGDFAVAYADQVGRDHAQFVEALGAGRL
jgi:uncharacterized protein (DUF2252 family)